MTFPIGKRVLVVSGPEPELPPVGRQAINFTRAMVGEAVSHIRGNPSYVSDYIAAVRFATCQTCEHFRQSDNRCAHPDCGCKLKGALIEKTRLFGQRCPIGKW